MEKKKTCQSSMDGWIVVTIVIVVALFWCVFREDYDLRYAKGAMGVTYNGSPSSAYLLGGAPGTPKTFNWEDISPKDDTIYSLYSTKVWPTTYQPVTNTCYDEYMRELCSKCKTKECMNGCMVKATSICTQEVNIPKTISHPF